MSHILYDIQCYCQLFSLFSVWLRARYGLRANQAGTYLATFRVVARKYPHRQAAEILEGLVKTTPGEEGKWFAAAKEAGRYDEALALAGRTPCDPKTLARAARDFTDDQPAFAVGAGLLALHWMVQGYGYEITSVDVWQAYEAAVMAAKRLGAVEATCDRIKKMIAAGGPGVKTLTYVVGRELSIPQG
jgi:hypothetical protein